ncbi:hypothetical protein GN956_G14376 [Arapaima gigas]
MRLSATKRAVPVSLLLTFPSSSQPLSPRHPCVTRRDVLTHDGRDLLKRHIGPRSTVTGAPRQCTVVLPPGHPPPPPTPEEPAPGDSGTSWWPSLCDSPLTMGTEICIMR